MHTSLRVAILVLLSICFLNCSFAKQINPMAYGKILKIEEFGNYYLIGGSDILYIFHKNGTLANFLEIPMLSDFTVFENTIVVSSYSQQFPNIRCYTFPELKLLWEFEPKMKVFDEYLVWHEIEPRSWRVKKIDNYIGVCSGYSFYILDKNGRIINQFDAENDLWDFIKKDSKYYLASQNGYIYVLSNNLSLIKKIKVCQDYELVNLITNTTKEIFSRSVWHLIDKGNLIAACEDGYLYFMESDRISKKIELELPSSSKLYSYYTRLERETGFADENFKNLKMKKLENGIIAWTRDTLGFLDGKGLKWKISTAVRGDVCAFGKVVYVPKQPQYGKELIYKYSLQNGSYIGKISLPELPCERATPKILCDKEGILIASDCEIKFIDYKGNVKWYFPRLKKFKEFRLKDKIILAGSVFDRPLDEFNAYYLLAIKDGELLWSYKLPYREKEKKIKEIKVSEKNGIVVGKCSESNGKDSFFVLNATDGKLLYEGELTKKIFPGVLDNYLLNQSLINIVRNFNYSIIEEIPSEIWEGRVEEAIRNYGEEQVREWMAALSNLPLDLELLWKFRSVNLDDIQHLKLPKNIEKIDVCDLTGDGSEDILISSDRLLSIIDGKTFKEIALIDAETWKYENDFNREFKENYTKEWFDSDYLAICANSPKENATYLFLYTWEKYKLVKKKGSNYEVEWKKSVKNFRREWTRKIEDIDGDGIDDLIIGFWREERPEIVKFLGLKYHLGTEGTAEGGEFSWKLNIGDLNGDGANESVVVYHDDEGCNIKIFSRFYKFEYRAFREFWETWNKYHYLMPIENIGDLNGDGSEDVAIGIVNKGEKGAKIIFMDVKNNKKIKTIDLERSEKEFDPREWIYVNDITRNKDILAVSLSTLEWENEEPKVVFYNLTDNKIVAVLYEDARRILKYKDGFIIITTEGKIIPISTYGNLNVTVETEGGEVRVRWNKNGYARVYVNGILAASLRGKEARIRLDNGNYEIKVALLDDEGYEIYGYGNVKVFKVSNLSFLNIILALIIISLAAIRFWVRK